MLNNTQKQFFDLFKEEIENHIDYDATEEETINTIYNSDLNFKHADPTTHQRCLDEYEISSLLEAGIEHLCSFDDRCSNCGKVIQNEDYMTAYESRGEYWGAPCSEQVTTGYKCHYCDYGENF